MNMNKEEILSTIQEIADFCKTIERRKKTVRHHTRIINIKQRSRRLAAYAFMSDW